MRTKPKMLDYLPAPIEEEIEIQVPEKLVCLFDSYHPSSSLYYYRYFALHGGRGGAKSRSIGAALVALGQAFPLRILCAREIQNSIKESVKRLLDDEIERQGASSFYQSNDKRIWAPSNGTEFIFEGLHRNYDKIKSYEGIDICWVEEAHTCSQESIDVLEPTIRKPGSMLWYSWNPRNIHDSIQLQFCSPDGPPPLTKLIEINYKDNPWFPEVLRIQMEHTKKKDFKKYLHIWEGQPVGEGGNDVFPMEYIQAAVDVVLPDAGRYSAGLAVADEGGDTNVLTISKGPCVKLIEEWAEGNTTQTARRAYNLLRQRGLNQLNFDSIGVGAGIKGEFWSLNSLGFAITAIGVNVGEAPSDDQWEPGVMCKEMFLNLKAELYFRLRRKLEKTYEYHVEGVDHDPGELLSIPNDSKLIMEMAQIKFEIMENGKTKIESKKQMAARGVKSPNKLDSLILAKAKATGLAYFGAI